MAETKDSDGGSKDSGKTEQVEPKQKLNWGSLTAGVVTLTALVVALTNFSEEIGKFYESISGGEESSENGSAHAGNEAADGNVSQPVPGPPPPPPPPPPPVVRIPTDRGYIETSGSGPVSVVEDSGGRRSIVVCQSGQDLVRGQCITPPPRPSPPPPLPPPCPECPPPPPPAACAAGPYIVFFDWDKDDITAQAAAILDNAAAAYQATCSGAQVVLASHADRSGSAQYNVGLSERRARNARSYLADRGVPDGSITTQAFGESRPLVDTADGVREPQNRRVEVTFGSGSGW